MEARGGGGVARVSPGEVPVLAARGRVLGPPPGEPRFFQSQEGRLSFGY